MFFFSSVGVPSACASRIGSIIGGISPFSWAILPLHFPKYHARVRFSTWASVWEPSKDELGTK